MKTRKIHDVVDKIKANPPKPRKPRPPKPTLLPIPKEQSPTTPSPPTPTGHSITSPSRKMIPPSKSYVPIQPTPPKASDWKYAAIPSAKPVVQNQPLPTQTSNHMMSRKRSHDGGQVQQNGIDGKMLEIIRLQDVVVYSSARAWTSVILARKHGSRRHSTAGTFSEIRELNGDVTRDDSQRRLLEQRDVATLVWIAATLFQHCNALFRRRRRRQRERQTIGWIGKTATLHVHRAFLSSLHDYDVKMSNFSFYGGRELKTTTFLFFSWTSIQSFRTQVQKILPTFDELSDME